MKGTLTVAMALAVCLGTTAAFVYTGEEISRNPASEAQLATDGAFRDGLYVGRLAAEGGRPMRPHIGRWASEKDRASFVSGYRRGYEEVVSRAGLEENKAQ